MASSKNGSHLLARGLLAALAATLLAAMLACSGGADGVSGGTEASKGINDVDSLAGNGDAGSPAPDFAFTLLRGADDLGGAELRMSDLRASRWC